MAKRYENIDEILDFVLDADSENEIDLGESDSEQSLSELDYDEGEDEPAVQFVTNENILHPVQVVEESESTTNDAIPDQFSDEGTDLDAIPEQFSNESSDDEPLAKIAKNCTNSADPVEDTNSSVDVVDDQDISDTDETAQHRRGRGGPGRANRGRSGGGRAGPRVLARGAIARIHNQLGARGRGRGRAPGRGPAPGLDRAPGRGPAPGRGRAPGRAPLSNWEKINVGENQNLKDFVFAETEGIIPRIGDRATCLDFLNLYFTDEVWDLLVTETNRFADQFFQTNPPSTYTAGWVAVTVDEMKAFIGLVMLMGVVHKPTIRMFWSTDILYNTPIFSQVMTRDRFYQILKFLHFNNNEDPAHDVNDENRDQLHKLQPLIDIFCQ